MEVKNPPIQDVVQIETGKRYTPALIQQHKNSKGEVDWDYWYDAASLKKDGQPRLVGLRKHGYIGARSSYYDYSHHYAYVIEEREARADVIRNTIALLHQSLKAAKDSLLAVYQSAEPAEGPIAKEGE